MNLSPCACSGFNEQPGQVPDAAEVPRLRQDEGDEQRRGGGAPRQGLLQDHQLGQHLRAGSQAN